MLKTAIAILTAIAHTASALADRLTALESRWQEARPALEERLLDFVVDASLTAEENVTETIKAFAWAGAKIGGALRLAYVSARRGYASFRAWLAAATPAIRETAAKAGRAARTGADAASARIARDTGKARAGISKITSRAADAWEFRHEIVTDGSRT